MTLKTIVAALREGDPLHLLPDMDFGVEDSLLVPFYSGSAGYEVQVMPDQYFWVHKRFKARLPGVAEVY